VGGRRDTQNRARRVTAPTAPAGWFEVLLEEELGDGAGLPASFRAVYGGDWRLSEPAAEPYLFVNLVVGHDGRVSFNDPGHTSGGDVSGFDARDRWLMGLLRARADAILVGDGTMRSEPDHVWTAEFIAPQDADAFAELRRAEGRRPFPLQVIMSLSGELPSDAAVLGRDELELVVATTTVGRDAARETGATVLELGIEAVDVRALLDELGARGARTVLCEGGPRVYGSVLAAGVQLDEFLTLSPLVLGDGPGGPQRPSLVEGVRFAPGAAPRSRLLSVRRGDSHLYLRSRYG
jgi:riboflavin biosynthesis pyrimidine reductase